MEFGSVLELDDIVQYKIPEREGSFCLPFMNGNAMSFNTVFYQSGRNAIEDLLSFLSKNKAINKAIVPDYICHTVKDAIVRADVEIIEYKIDKYYNCNVEEIEKKIDINSCVYLCHYFGNPFTDELIEAVKRWKKEGIIVIEDITLSLLSNDSGRFGVGSYILGSLRKWFPIPDGGFIASESDELPHPYYYGGISKYTDYYMVVQTLKRNYINDGCRDKELKKIYLDYYKLSIEELFSDYRIYPLSEWSKNYLQNADINKITSQRIRNYTYLYNRLSANEKIKIQSGHADRYVPLGVVLDVEDRDSMLNYMIRNDVYCNVHWRFDNNNDNKDMEYLSSHSVTIPCDQRYSIGDMEIIANIVEKWYEK